MQDYYLDDQRFYKLADIQKRLGPNSRHRYQIMVNKRGNGY